MAGYVAIEAYGSRGCGQRHVVHTCEILCLKVMATFADHLSLLCFLMNSQCTKVTAMASFNHSSLWQK